jgi:hypothetical protein
MSAADLIAMADEIDNRLGPIPGHRADTIADQLREAGAALTETQAKIEIIYGLLWLMEIDTTTVTGMAASLARKTVLEMVDKDGQERGISIAKRAVRGKMLQAIPVIPTTNPRGG